MQRTLNADPGRSGADPAVNFAHPLSPYIVLIGQENFDLCNGPLNGLILAQSKRGPLMNTIELKRASATLAGLQVDLKLISLSLALKRYDPNQPRWPAGVSEGGQWRPAGGSSDVAAKFDPKQRAECDLQRELDYELCRMSQSSICGSVAMERHDQCMRGVYVTPLRH